MTLALMIFQPFSPYFSRVWAQSASPAQAASPAQSAVVDVEGRFTFTLPPGFKTVPVPDRNALVLLRKEGEEFPSFNVVLQRSPRLLRSTQTSELQEEILSSYRLVGITDVRSADPRFVECGGSSAFSLELRYQNGGIPLHSRVLLLPFQEDWFILTWIDTEERFNERKDFLDLILKSLVLHGQQERGDAPPEEEGRVLLVLLLVSIVIVVTVWKRRRARSGNY